MRAAHWAVVITIFYALVLALLVFPLLFAALSADADSSVTESFLAFIGTSTLERDGDPEFWTAYWLSVTVLVVAQILLLFVAVGGEARARRRPRQHVFVCVLAASLAVGILTVAAFWSLVTGIFGDAPLDVGETIFLGSPIVFWALWGAVFYIYRHRLSQHCERLVTWLIKGSILELLIAVPAHIVTRQRDDCCAPGVTLAGIATGIAVMLMAFGPAVIFLYQRRLEDKRRRDAPPGPAPGA